MAAIQPDEKTIDDHLAVQAIIRSYQVIECVLMCMQISHNYTNEELRSKMQQKKMKRKYIERNK